MIADVAIVCGLVLLTCAAIGLCALAVLRTLDACGATREYVYADERVPVEDRCRPAPSAYYQGGPVTPMSSAEAEEDRHIQSHRCARGTVGCFVEHRDVEEGMRTEGRWTP